MNILMVMTSHDQLGDTGRKTGLWLEEFAAPYFLFKDAGAEVTLVSPKGGQVPLDPKSDDPSSQTESITRFKQDTEAQEALANTLPLSSIHPDVYDAVFYPGGHGPLWDLADNRDSILVIETIYNQDKPVAAVCHGPAVFKNAHRNDGKPLVEGKRVTGFANSEEEAAQLTNIVPFLVEDVLKQNGGQYSKGADWSEHVVEDGNLITGQNPASSEAAARAVLERLRNESGIAMPHANAAQSQGGAPHRL
ncbi:type 1 glutamine amidotransferase domain-containing protein [Noviherbaspirillum sp.]|uniref:type 1 glutamine amidotransferase domain-containing protein n=1 Tax=Noviherbaspirillum sp. TaxID=1926288 RepID=UPI002FE08C19